MFRPPARAGLLAAYVGTGAQLLAMTVVTMIFAVLGFLSPANRGGLMTAMLLLFAFMGIVAGYSSARLYKSFKVCPRGAMRSLCSRFELTAMPCSSPLRAQGRHMNPPEGQAHDCHAAAVCCPGHCGCLCLCPPLQVRPGVSKGCHVELGFEGRTECHVLLLPPSRVKAGTCTPEGRAHSCHAAAACMGTVAKHQPFEMRERGATPPETQDRHLVSLTRSP